MNPFMVAATAVRSTELCHNVMRPEVGSGERKRQTSSASSSKQLTRGCASVPACQDFRRSAMDPSSWNHQQELGDTDCVSGEHHPPMLHNVPWA